MLKLLEAIKLLGIKLRHFNPDMIRDEEAVIRVIRQEICLVNSQEVNEYRRV